MGKNKRAVVHIRAKKAQLRATRCTRLFCTGLCTVVLYRTALYSVRRVGLDFGLR